MKEYVVPGFATLTIFAFSYVSLVASQGIPEKQDCTWALGYEVKTMRDLSDCNKFYYCAEGLTPLRAACPWNDNGYFMYYNPNISRCDHYWKAPEDCFGSGGEGDYETVTVTTTSTTTPATTTTTKAPRPPELDDQPDFKIDCRKKLCGLFPNTYGACNTYVVCVNGERLEKKCNGGQLFDVKTKECQPANQATCWKEPNAGPHIRKGKNEDCPFHGNRATNPIEKRQDGVILQNPVVTNWGEWGTWQECPKGMYATGIYAWRRLLMQGRQMDHAGITAVSFICQSPGGNETQNIIESLAPNLPRDGWPFYYMCKGAVVGFRLNSVDRNGLRGDQVATDNVQGMCSCSGPVYKPYEQAIYAPQSGNRGIWTTPQYCEKGQAVCGMQTQMQEYKEYMIGRYDNNGMNNMRVKCCDVPNPLETCTPNEERILVRTCDNSKSDEGLRCDFESEVGYSMDYESNEKLVNLYSSVGYSFDLVKAKMSTMIEENLKKAIEDGNKLEYTWDDVVPSVRSNPTITSKTMYLKPYETLELYQIVGKCSYFLVRSNRYVRLIKDGISGALKKEEYFEI